MSERNRVVQVRFTDRERAWIDQARAHEPLASWARRVMLEAAFRKPITPAADKIENT